MSLKFIGNVTYHLIDHARLPTGVWWTCPPCGLFHTCTGVDSPVCGRLHVGSGIDLPAPTVCWSTVIFAGVADVAGLRPACIAMLASRCQGRIQNFVLGRILAGGLGTSVPSEVQGQSPGEGLGRSPQKPEECYVMRLKKHGDKKTVYADCHCMTIP